MVETVNLRLARKRKERAERERAAQHNRARFGRSRAETDRDKALRALDEARLRGHRRDDGDD
jgi:DNA-binding IclR family transcriptional regulator